MLTLWYTQTSVSEADEQALLSTVSKARRDVIAHRPKADRIASAAAAALLRYAMQESGYAEFVGAEILWQGKPRFADDAIPLYFNLTHTYDRETDICYAAVLLSDSGSVGVDAEVPRVLHNQQAMMQRLFLPGERAYVRTTAKDDAFFDIWCAKEAYIKWTGEGFSRPLSSVQVCVEGQYAESDGCRCNLRWMKAGAVILCAAGERLLSDLEPIYVPITEITVP